MRKVKKIQRKFLNGDYTYYIMIMFIIAIILSFASAYFSIFGLSHLFNKARLSVIIMAASLEAAKIISVSIRYRFKEILNFKTKSLLTIAIIGLMLITSLGVYSYLVNAYQKVSDNIEFSSKEEKIILQKIKNIEFSLDAENEKLKIIQKRFSFLNDINKRQEIRLTEALKNKNNYTISKTRNGIVQTLSEIQKLNFDIDKAIEKIDNYNNERNKLNGELSKINLKNSEIIDIGPLKFISKLFGMEIDKTVNILIIIIVVIFDPLAILLIYIANVVYVYVVDNNSKNGKKRKYTKRKKRRKKRRKNGIMNEEEVK